VTGYYPVTLPFVHGGSKPSDQSRSITTLGFLRNPCFLLNCAHLGLIVQNHVFLGDCRVVFGTLPRRFVQNSQPGVEAARLGYAFSGE
jgi:hypothetical protein